MSKIMFTTAPAGCAWFWWQGSYRLWVVALLLRLKIGPVARGFTRAWCLGPVTIALTDLRGKLYGNPGR